MELSYFKYLMREKFGIRIHNVTVNTTRDDKELIWSDILWKDIPALVKLSGARRSDIMMQFVARCETQHRNRHVYVTGFRIVVPITGSGFSSLASQYAYGYVTRMPVKHYYGHLYQYNVGIGSLGTVNDQDNALIYEFGKGNQIVDNMSELLRSVSLWESIITNPEIIEKRQKVIAARAEAKKWNDLARQALRDCRGYIYSNDFDDYEDKVVLQATKKVALAIEGNPNYLKGKGVKAIH